MTKRKSEPAAIVAGLVFVAGMLVWLVAAAFLAAHAMTAGLHWTVWWVWASCLILLVVGTTVVYGIVQAATRRRRQRREVQILDSRNTHAGR